MLAFLGVFALGRAEISIDNIEAGAVVRYPLVILRGHCGGDSIAVGRTWDTASRFAVVKGEFKALVELRPGQNMVLLQTGRDLVRFRLDYQPPTTKLKVLTVWMKGSDGGEPQGLRERLDVAMKLLQSFTAEAMNAAGYGRKTFPLELDRDGRVVVHVVSSPKTEAELRAMENNENWRHVYQVLQGQFDENTTHWCTLLGWSTYDVGQHKSLGYYALGGGSLGAFGTSAFGWWPSSVKEVPKAFLDATRVDPATGFEDSNHRETVWANVSTALGAIAHEMGHAFGLPHSADDFSVMSRGFDFFSRSFVVEEAPSARSSVPVLFGPKEVSRWDPFSAARLNWNPYFQPDEAKPTTEGEPMIDFHGDEVILRAPAGIRVYGADRDDRPATWSEFREGEPPKEVRLSRADLRNKLNTKETFRITLIDTAGRQVVVEDRM